MVISKIKKRDSKVVKFESLKITNAITKALKAVKKKDDILAEKLSKEVVKELEKIFKLTNPTVEDVQNMVEEILIKEDLTEVAKAFILYRQKHKEIRETKKFFGVKDKLKLTLNATRVLERRYLLKDENGKVIETPDEMFKRTAKVVAKAEKKKDQAKYEKEFHKILSTLEFIPNSPTLMNADTKLGMLSACFVVPISDSLKSIFDAVKTTAIIQQAGGGTGFTFTHLRPKGDMVQSTKGIASGPVSFIRIFDTTTDVIKQGSKRRGANMGILNIEHPDVVEFITSKSKEDAFTNFNFSVGVTDKFMKAVKKNKDYNLINPRTGKEVGKLNAAEVFDMITMYAWRTGDPGLIFLDQINKKNPLVKKMGEIEATNPCGEAGLYPYESCNLGSINLAKFVKNKKVDWNKLKEVIQISTRFLDNVIDVNKYPVKEIEKISKANRRIGLGVMGFAEMLIQLEISYDSKDAVKIAEKVMKFINNEAVKISEELAKEKGEFPNFKKSDYKKKRRNVAVTTVAPTGTISIIAGCSSGIEPLFAVTFVRNVMGGTKLIEINPYFEKIAKEQGFYSEDLMSKIARTGSIQKLNIPENIKKIFRTALDIDSEWHVKIQAAFQSHTENAVSKTINFPREATVDEVKQAYLQAYKLGCKGVTIYRYGSKKEQVLYLGTVIGREEGETLDYVSAESEYSGGCPYPFCPH